MSVFQVHDLQTNKARLVAATQLTRTQSIHPMGCVVFDSGVLDELGISSEKTNPETPDTVANDCHYDLLHVTASQLVALTKVLLESSDCEEFSLAELEEAVNAGLTSRSIVAPKMSAPVQKQFQATIAQSS